MSDKKILQEIQKHIESTEDNLKESNEQSLGAVAEKINLQHQLIALYDEYQKEIDNKQTE